MSNVLKVEFKETYLTNENIKYLLSNYEPELKANNFKNIIEKEFNANAWDDNSFIWAVIEYMSNYNEPWPYDTILENIFDECDNLTSITIPERVTSIGDQAFKWCCNLTSIEIPNNVTSIGWGAFSNCTSLTNITIPDTVTSIEQAAFSNCESLTSITIPNNVTSIVQRTFVNCTSLTNITIPDSVTNIGEAAFFNCDELSIHTKNPYVIDYCEEHGIKYKEI